MGVIGSFLIKLLWGLKFSGFGWVGLAVGVSWWVTWVLRNGCSIWTFWLEGREKSMLLWIGDILDD